MSLNFHGLLFISPFTILKPCEPAGTNDQRYLNQNHASLVNTFKKELQIELYNEKNFNKPINTSISPITYKHCTLKFRNKSFPQFPSLSKFHKGTDTYPPQPLRKIVLFSFPLFLLIYITHSSIQISLSLFNSWEYAEIMLVPHSN